MVWIGFWIYAGFGVRVGWESDWEAFGMVWMKVGRLL